MIYLHIGRGKAGSTTIQHFLSESIEVLGSHNVEVVDMRAFMSAASRDLGTINTGNAGSRCSIRALAPFAAHFAAHPQRTFLLSSEFLIGIKGTSQLETLRDVFGTHAIKILVYLREYAGWSVSLYNQSTKKGKNVASFDQFFLSLLERVSAVPSIRRWMSVFGQDSMRVRDLSRAALERGDLVADFSTATGIAQLPGLPSMIGGERNSSDHWAWVELRREIERAAARTTGARPPAKALQSVFRRWMAISSRAHLTLPPRAGYLTLAQQEAATRIYNDDAAVLRKLLSDVKLDAPTACTEGERSFIPAVAALPASLMDELLRTLGQVRRRGDDEQLAVQLMWQVVSGNPLPVRIGTGKKSSPRTTSQAQQ